MEERTVHGKKGFQYSSGKNVQEAKQVLHLNTIAELVHIAFALKKMKGSCISFPGWPEQSTTNRGA